MPYSHLKNKSKGADMAALAKKRMELASVPNFDAPFLSQAANKENADMNQYWYSQPSIQVTLFSLCVSVHALIALSSGYRGRGPRCVCSRRLRVHPQFIFLASRRASQSRQQSVGCKNT
jgi:hypothetical protein